MMGPREVTMQKLISAHYDMIHTIDDRGFGRGRGRGPPGRRPPPPGGRPGRRPNNNNNGFTGPFGGNLGTVATAGTERVTLH